MRKLPILTIEEFNLIQLGLVAIEFQGSFMQKPTLQAIKARELYNKLREETERTNQEQE